MALRVRCRAFFWVAAALGPEAIVSGERQIIRMELKYCEACGALRLRVQGSDKPYCGHCAKVMAGLSHTVRTKPAEGKRA
jgi:ribosomal protein L37AE/L43A